MSVSKYNILDKAVNDISNISVFGADKDRVIFKWNKASEKLYGYKAKDAIGKKIEDLIIPAYLKEVFIEEFNNSLKEGKSINGKELEYRKSDNSLIIVHVNSVFIKDDNENINYYSFNIDPSKFKQIKILDSLIQHGYKKDLIDMRILQIELDRDANIVSFNSFATEQTGYKEKEVIGKNFVDIFIPDSYKDRTKEQVITTFQTGKIALRSSFPIVCKNGVKKIIHWSVTVQNKSKDRSKSLILSGIRANEKLSIQENLEYLANYDTLTDLPNKNLLYERMRSAINKATYLNKNMVTMFLNINNFKSINHTLGYSAGDALLKSVAKRLYSKLRDYDTIARFNGDEFVIIFENVSCELVAGTLANRVMELFAKPFKVDENEIFLNVNAGISFFPSDGNDVKTLLKHANLAMLKTKNTLNTYRFFKPQMSEEITRKVTLENSLRQAIENDEFVIQYQPIVDISDNTICGAEALIRWDHPKLKMIPPLDFIPIAEDSGLIQKIGQLILKKATNQMKNWHDQGYDNLKISINISGVQLLQSSFLDSVKTILKESKLKPEFLELELTESVLVQNINLASTLLKKIKDEKISIAIDDFGTGYSSLSYLVNLPIDSLKIDQSFIKNTKDNKNKAIVSTIIAMAKALNLNIIAEGVEKKEQFEYLKRQNCDMIQGYYFSKPLDANEFEELIKKTNCKLKASQNIKVDYDQTLEDELKKYSSFSLRLNSI